MFEDALLYDSHGRPIRARHCVHTRDWEEIREFCHRAYVPCRISPAARHARPDAALQAFAIGRLTVSWMSFGTAVRADRFERSAEKILVSTTIAGQTHHGIDRGEAVTTCAEESFVVDCGRVDYRFDADEGNLQLHLAIPRALFKETARRWLGVDLDERLWTIGTRFGGPRSAWFALLQYLVRTIGEASERLVDDRGGPRLDELVCIEVLRSWTASAGIRLDAGGSGVAPYYVRAAEALMRRRAFDPPAIAEVAAAVGVSVRTLSGGFRRFRGSTPRKFLSEQRLIGIREALRSAGREETVTMIASRWGYANFGVFAKLYRTHFGELPSVTLSNRIQKLPPPSHLSDEYILRQTANNADILCRK